MPHEDDAVTRGPTPQTDVPADSLATRAPSLPQDGTARPTHAGEETLQPSGAGRGLRFRVLRPHARGGLGEVHVAHDIELRREVALKQIQDRHADHQDSRSRFLLEAEITGGLEHPGIVPVYGLGQYADGRPYYAMRFIRGDSLKEAVEQYHAGDAKSRGPLQLRNLLGRLVDVCQAIAYAHSRGVLHRDLKPGNIMLGKYGETLVVDWGLAKPLDQPGESATGEPSLTLSSESSLAATQMGAVVGTPQFMSPEQAAGDVKIMGPASDTYSLGATLYVLLTGKPPFVDKDLATILDKVQRGDFVQPRQIDGAIHPALEAICLKAMATKPADRYESPLALAEDIEHWLGDEPVSAWKEPWSVQAARWLRRHRTLATALFTGIIATSIVLGIATILLTAANERERRAKAVAESNYRLARAAVDRYHTEVSEEVLLNEPGMQELRQKLLGAAKEFYQKFVEARQHDSQARVELGRAYFRLAQISGDIESESKAIALHTRALAMFGDSKSADVARTHHHLGRLQRIADDLAKSEASYTKALALWQELNEHPAELARTQLGLGNLYQVTRRTSLAEEQYRTALAAREKLVEGDPKNLAYRRDLAVAHNNLAMVLRQTSPEKAEASFQRARAIQEQLVAERPSVAQYQDDLSRTDFNLGDLYVQSKKVPRAQEAYVQAAKRWQELVRLHPAVLDFQTNLAEAHGNAANAFRLSNQFVDAETNCQQALAIKQKLADEHRDVPSYQGDLARGYYQLADIHRVARETAEAEKAYDNCIRLNQELAERFADVPTYMVELARAYNNLGLLWLAEYDGDRAIAALEKSEQQWEALLQRQSEAAEFAAGLCTARTNLAQAHRLAGKTQLALDDCNRALAIAKLPPRTLSAAHWKRAEILGLSGAHAKALQDWDTAYKLAESAERPWINLFRLMTRAQLGDFLAVTAEADTLAEKAARSGRASYCLGCIYALAAQTANQGSLLDATKKTHLTERWTSRALEMLARAKSLGYFRQPENARLLTTDPALASLQAHEVFRKLNE